jgi:hypothetical protein
MEGPEPTYCRRHGTLEDREWGCLEFSKESMRVSTGSYIRNGDREISFVDKIFSKEYSELKKELQMGIDDKFSMSSSTSSNGMYGEPELYSAVLANGEMRLYYRARPCFTYTTGLGGKPPCKVWYDVYQAKDGMIIMGNRVYGKHVPAQMISESYEFDKDE